MLLPASMRQVRFHGAGGPEVIGVETAPVPAPGPGQVLIAVTAAGVNRPDCLQRAGKYPPPPGATDVPGLEVSGTVTVLGPGVSSLAEGDQACALVASGGYAEFCVADEALCLPVPASIPLIEAGGIPETFFTVYDNLFTRGRLIPGEIVLVHGGSSGIGSTAIQLAREAGATVYATAGSAAKCSFCLSLGASAAFNHREQDFVAEVKALTGGTGVDVILDMVGGPYVDRNLKCLRTDGRLVQIAFLQGSRVDIDMTPIMVRRLTVTGSTLRPRSVALKAEIAKALRQRVWPWLEHGAVRPVIDCVMPLSEARAAHELMESGRHMGKIVLSTGRA